MSLLFNYFNNKPSFNRLEEKPFKRLKGKKDLNNVL